MFNSVSATVGNRLLGAADSLYNSMISIRAKYFFGGWGIAEEIRKYNLRSQVDIESLQLSPARQRKGYLTQDGVFTSPATADMKLHDSCSTGHFRLVLPPETEMSAGKQIPLAVLLGSTGDEGYAWREKHVAVPLAVQSGVASLILEYPFYGQRRPPWQSRSYLSRVSDLMQMTYTSVEEVIALLRWAEGSGRFGPFVIGGLSFGGTCAGICAKTIASTENILKDKTMVVSHLGSCSGGPVYTQGCLARRVDWNALASEIDMEIQGAMDYMNNLLDPYRNTELILERGEKEKAVPSLPFIQLMAVNDKFVPQSSSMRLHHLTNSELRVLTGGHVYQLSLGFHHFRKAISDAITTMMVRNESTGNPVSVKIK